MSRLERKLPGNTSQLEAKTELVTEDSSPGDGERNVLKGVFRAFIGDHSRVNY